MRITIQLPDKLFEDLQAKAQGDELRTASYLSQLIKRFAKIDPMDRIVVVDQAARAELEEILGHGSIMDAKDLVAKVRRLSDIEIEKVELKFTLGQKAELQRIAVRQGISYKEIVRRTVKSMEAQFFDYAH